MKKIGIITGASSGMGKEFALQISKTIELDELWLIARRKEKLESLSKIIKEECNLINFNKNLNTKAIQADLSTTEGLILIENLIKQDEHNIQILINNAGFGTYGTFSETPLNKELEMIDLNCKALTFLCGISIPFMNKGSVLINVGSLASFTPLGNFAVYAATKAYVLNFSLALGQELKSRGIKVSSLCPGPVSTEFANVASNGARKEVKHGVNAKKVVSHCLKRALKGKVTSLYTFKWKFASFASNFVSKNLIAWYTYKFCKRPYQK